MSLSRNLSDFSAHTFGFFSQEENTYIKRLVLQAHFRDIEKLHRHKNGIKCSLAFLILPLSENAFLFGSPNITNYKSKGTNHIDIRYEKINGFHLWIFLSIFQKTVEIFSGSIFKFSKRAI